MSSRHLTSSCAAALLFAAGAAHAANLRVPHSGFLLDSADQPVNAAAIPLGFRLVDRLAPDASEVTLWSAACSAPVQRGYYAVTLGDGTCGSALTSAALPFETPRYLEVTVSGVVLEPRLRLDALPNAAFAADAGALGGQSLAALDTRFLRVQGGPPAAQAGSVAVTGSVTAGSFTGAGGALTGLDATQLTMGTLPVARLPADVPLLSGGVLAGSVLPSSVVLTTGAQSIGGNKTFTGLTTLTGDLELSGRQLLGARLQNAGAAPTTCDANALGRVYFDTVANALKVCRATAWTTLADAASGAGSQLATYTTATRPTGVSAGYVIFNATTKTVDLWNGTGWVAVGGGVGGVEATGGTVTTVGNYTVHTFTSSGAFNVTAADANATLEVLVVGGGGGGGFWFAGGGGGGGVVYATRVPATAGSVSVTVGGGGAGQTVAPGAAGTAASYGVRGGDSSFGTSLVARGGGGGTGYNSLPGNAGELQYVDGGSGAGGRGNGNGPEGRPFRTYLPVATVGSVQTFGHRGGVMGGNFGGGGGGAGTPGNSGQVDGKGGDGLFFNFDGNPTYYGAGGGGGTTTGTSQGGLGGGGTGSTGQGGHATGYGSGGGSGGAGTYTGVTGGNGSAGVVIVRYPRKALTVQAFSTVGASTWPVPAGVTTVSVLVVGGGGGGAGSATAGSGPRGGGGAGGYVWNPNVSVTPGANVSVAVGGGGAGGAAGAENTGTAGQPSSFGTVTAAGGGAGGSHAGGALAGSSGGSGGGAAYVTTASAANAGTQHQGYRGGTSQFYGSNGAAGGGGAGGAGYDHRQAKEPSGGDKGSDTGGDGGEGRLSAITGSAQYYAGGGGAGGYPQGSSVFGVGGSGVGGNGASGTGTATAGLAGTGSGGGAGGSAAAGAPGGSGIVIVAY